MTERISRSQAQTMEIAGQMAEASLPGSVYSLTGDLGAGKTVFAKGFARGLGVSETVTSPTFTILIEYLSGRLPFYHFDAYRLKDAAAAYDMGISDYFYGDGVCLVEWGEVVKSILPKNAVRVEITGDTAQDPDFRIIRIFGTEGAKGGR